MRYGRDRPGVSSIVGSIFFVLIMLVAIASLVTMFNSFNSYNQQVNKASSSNLQAQETGLSITSAQFGPFPPSTPSSSLSFNVGTACTTTATAYTNGENIFYASGMWWVFYTCNSAFQYSASFNGVTWETEVTIPGTIAYATGDVFDVQVVGSTIYLAISEKGSALFEIGIGTLVASGTSSAPIGTISWTDTPAPVTATATTFGPIGIAVDSAGNQWVAVVQYATGGTCSTTTNCAIAVYEHEACATGSATGWENAVSATCGNTNAPGNYAPTATPNFGALSEDAQVIVLPAISSYSTTGVIVLYESGFASTFSTGTLAVATSTALASTAWTPISLSAFTDYYSLTSSSAVVIGTTLYFAGLVSATSAQTTGSLKFWTLPFTSMTAAVPTTEQSIEGTGLGSIAWQAALTYTGTTLVLFDNPPAGIDSCPAGDNCIQYYSTGNFGTFWSSYILLDSSESSAVTYLEAASGAFAAAWTSSTGDNVRFAALSTLTVSNSSPFAVHLVDLYVYNSGTNTLVAHWYYNATGVTGGEDFDYWVGQGTTMAIPVRFVWASTTTYLITVGSDTGVTAQLTATSPPTTSTTCSAGNFLSQISPVQTCSGVPTAAAPVVSYQSSAAAACSIGATATSAGFTTPLTYTTSSGSSGNLFIGMTFNVVSPATAALTSKWQFAYGTGTAPACAATTGLGTTVGDQYTIETQAGSAGSWGQSIGVAIKGLAAGTTYWFDVQVTDSSAGAWLYQYQALSITDVSASTNALPNVSINSNTLSCTHTAAASNLMAGLGVTYTTMRSSIGSGNLKLTLSFNLQSPATGATAITNAWQMAYGTGTAPACNAAEPPAGLIGTVGKQYTVAQQVAGTTQYMQLPQSETVVIDGLSPSTTYWFDVESTDSTTDQWITSSPTLAVSEESNTVGGNIPANIVYPLSAQTAGCATTAAATSMAGLRELYTLTSTSTGTIYGTLTFRVQGSGTIAAGSTSAWKLAYSDITANAMPACAAAAVGTVTNMQPYTVETVSTTAFSEGQTFQFAITGLTPGHTYWFDLEVTNTGAAFTATYSVPDLTITDIQPANVVHSNLIQLTGNAPGCEITTAAAARMGGMAVIPTTANPPMEYQTTSYGSGVVQVTYSMLVTTAATAQTAKFQFAYGTVTDGTANPACTVAATGTVVGNGYTQTNTEAVATTFVDTVTVTINLAPSGTTHGTEYWFDFQCTNSVATSTNSLPQLTVLEGA